MTSRAGRKRRRRSPTEDAGSYLETLEVLKEGVRAKSYFGDAADIREVQDQIEWLVATEDEIRRLGDERLERRNSRRLVVAIVVVRLALSLIAGCALAACFAVLLIQIARSKAGSVPPALYATSATATAYGALQFLLNRFLRATERSSTEAANANGREPAVGSDLD